MQAQVWTMSVPGEDPNMHASVKSSARAGVTAESSTVATAVAETIERTFMILP